MPDKQDIYNELPFSADEGWAEMQLLLNRKLPVKKRMAVLRLLFPFLPAALLCSICMLSFLQLDTAVFTLQQKKNIFIEPQATVSSLIKRQKKYNTAETWSNSVSVNKNNNRIPGNANLPGTEIITGDAAIYPVLQKIRIDDIRKDILPDKKTGSSIQIIPVNTEAKDFPMAIVPGKKQKLVPRWGLAAGIGVNMAAGKTQHLQPYPVAEVKYNINRHVFIAAGVSLFSPVPVNVSGIKKTVYVNDTASNIRSYNEQVRYHHLRYADVPVFAGVNITKKISFQAGLQASFLLSSKQEKKLQPYDFGMNSVDAMVSPLFGAPAGPQEEFTMQLRNIDYRFITGIKYSHDKITAGLFYQHGLRSAGAGSHTSKNSNRLFTLSLLYRLK